MPIQHIKQLIKEQFSGEGSGHDWYHIERVYKMACAIQEKEGGDREIVELSALLHDISDHKLNGGKLNAGGDEARKLLLELNYDPERTEKIAKIVDAVSFKGALVDDVMDSIEGKIVQDADRLDAIGAIGIARAFAYGGSRNRPMYEPDFAPELHDNFQEYASSKSHTINHFYEKLLLLKTRLHTTTAKKVGEERHAFMMSFLDQFYSEWETKM
jgi:uncharacterized protein